MKNIKKFLFVMVAFAAALAFVSCSNDDDNGGGSNNGNGRTVAIYEGTNPYTDGITIITFFSNKSWREGWRDDSQTIETLSLGTYEGDPSKDGKITMTKTKGTLLTGELVDSYDSWDVEIEDGKFTYNYIYKMVRK
ncbi:MAG: hypothetical protein HDR34_06475 [Treponema sp.]|nr:hypothetical protein [Treponema sp.]